MLATADSSAVALASLRLHRRFVPFTGPKSASAGSAAAAAPPWPLVSGLSGLVLCGWALSIGMWSFPAAAWWPASAACAGLSATPATRRTAGTLSIKACERLLLLLALRLAAALSCFSLFLLALHMPTKWRMTHSDAGVLKTSWAAMLWSCCYCNTGECYLRVTKLLTTHCTRAQDLTAPAQQSRLLLLSTTEGGWHTADMHSGLGSTPGRSAQRGYRSVCLRCCFSIGSRYPSHALHFLALLCSAC